MGALAGHSEVQRLKDCPHVGRGSDAQLAPGAAQAQASSSGLRNQVSGVLCGGHGGGVFLVVGVGAPGAGCFSLKTSSHPRDTGTPLKGCVPSRPGKWSASRDKCPVLSRPVPLSRQWSFPAFGAEMSPSSALQSGLRHRFGCCKHRLQPSPGQGSQGHS